jgi:hypothetical protein
MIMGLHELKLTGEDDVNFPGDESNKLPPTHAQA